MDFSNVRVLLRLDHCKDVLSKLLVRNPHDLPAVIVRLRVVHYWVQVPGEAEPGDYNFIRAEMQTGGGWGRGAGGNLHGWYSRSGHPEGGRGNQRAHNARGPPMRAIAALPPPAPLSGGPTALPTFVPRGSGVPIRVVFFAQGDVRAILTHNGDGTICVTTNMPVASMLMPGNKEEGHAGVGVGGPHLQLLEPDDSTPATQAGLEGESKDMGLPLSVSLAAVGHQRQ